MENAANALGMAAAILVFIIALASSFSLFGTARETADSIIKMRDKQAYLQSADLDTILYTSSTKIAEGKLAATINTNGDRIVGIDDVISTIRRYAIEKYGVTIIGSDAKILARFDSSTEVYMKNWSNLKDEEKERIVDSLKKDLSNTYKIPDINENKLAQLYEATEKNTGKKIYAPWGTNLEEIQKRINADISGEIFIKYKGTSGEQRYSGKNLLEKLKGKKIIEITNEIDKSEYLEDGTTTTDLIQEYHMPTIEVIYIVE